MDDPLHLLTTVVSIAAVIYSIILHEIAHAWVALQCGDSTAKHAGRITLNPIPHIDPLMTIALPLLCYFTGAPIFGGAKPVPVDLRRVRRYRRDTILIGLAGIAMNLLIAGFSAIVLHLLIRLERTNTVAYFMLWNTMSWNVGLAMFNLIPIPPLDGSRAFRFLLDVETRWKYDKLERYGLVIVYVLCTIPAVSYGIFTVEAWILTLLGFGGS